MSLRGAAAIVGIGELPTRRSYPGRSLERHWRDVRLTTIFEGTSQIQQRIISDRLLPRSPLS